MYQIVEAASQAFVLRTRDGAVIPLDEANTDYQQYLEWLAEGNEPEVIDLSG